VNFKFPYTIKVNKLFSLARIIVLIFIFFLNTPILEAIELDLTAAQNSVGKRFASKFCEAKEEGFSIDNSSEFALNNTYLKFVALPNDEKFIEDLWRFTIGRIRNDCGDYITENEELALKDFFEEEGEIASNRDLYLPH
tara:strand:+ start:1166 stop:1582 length:417 start_codon:yes stop_codon:yes gene_type:complete